MGVASRLTIAALLACSLLATSCSNDDPTTTDPSISITPSTTTESSPQPSPSSPSSASAEAQAVAAAKARYLSAVAGRTRAAQDPRKATEKALVDSGAADPWLGSILEMVSVFRGNGLHQTGAIKVISMRPTKVVLTGEQPEVHLDACGDNRAISVRYTATNKLAPAAPGTKLHPRFRVLLRYAPATGRPGRNWYVVENTVVGSC